MMQPLPLHARLTWGAHLFKALTRQHHLGLYSLLEKHIHRGSVVIDVGAHAGQFTKLFSRLVPDGQVYAFEPGRYPLSILRKVRTMHRLKNVHIVPLGLSDHDTTATLQTPIKKTGSMGFGLSNLGTGDGRTNSTESIALTTLDRFVEENRISRMDFLKADIEGWELRMLMGARKSLGNFRPVLMLEANGLFLKRAGNTKEELLQFLSGMRYDVFEHDERGHLSDAKPDSEDLICIPRR
jgi:FkbM family methyltransferase